MSAMIFLAVLVLFGNEGKAIEAESICCEEIESLLKNKTTAYQTVCLGPESRLPSSCCANIETEIEKFRFAYKTLCHEVKKPGMFISSLNFFYGFVVKKGCIYIAIGVKGFVLGGYAV